MTETRSAEVRRSLDHPVLDSDGHFVEVWPLAHTESARLNLEWARVLGIEP